MRNFSKSRSSSPPQLLILNVTVLPLVGVWIFMAVGFSAVQVYGHGYLIDPPQRSSEWRLGFPNKVNYDDNGLNCGGFARQWIQNDGKCGVCGDAWDDAAPRLNEVGGPYARGIIVRRYTTGSEIATSIVITAQHKGWHEFRLCLFNETIEHPTTQECLDQHLLTIVTANSTRYTEPPEATAGTLRLVVKLPSGLCCAHCVLQWKWHTGNSWGIGPDGIGCLGCGASEEFINCADISISPDDAVTTQSEDNNLASLITGKETPSTQSSTVISNESTVEFKVTSAKSIIATTVTSTKAMMTPTAMSTKSTVASKVTSNKSTVMPAVTPSKSTIMSSVISNQSTESLAMTSTKSTVVSPNTETTESPPTATQTSWSSDLTCKAIGLFEGINVVDQWCATNCALDYCPPSLCLCSSQQLGPRDQPDFMTCKSKQPLWNSRAMDQWCISNCASGYCPSDYCDCSGN